LASASHHVSLHRDIPIRGLEREVRDPIEREADHFAACFLMPAKLLKKVFAEMFLVRDRPLAFDEKTIFHLGANDYESLLYPEADSYDREVALASARSFAGRRFEKSLADMFQVSVATMAIRIRELRLVRAWP
jgi:hypothetical protein